MFLPVHTELTAQLGEMGLQQQQQQQRSQMFRLFQNVITFVKKKSRAL